MGSLIARLMSESRDITLVAAAELSSHPVCGQYLSEHQGIKVMTLGQLSLESVDVVIDFTVPDTCLKTMQAAKQAGCRVVSGTTGLSAEQMEEVREIAKQIPVVHSPNMARGVNVFFHAVKMICSHISEEYGIEVVEIHHKHKKDAPSGTAKRLVEMIGRTVPCHSLRLGEVVGEHQVHFAAQGERLVLTHQAESREAFAQGALQAVRFVVKKEPGLYDMQQVLGLTP